MSRKTTLTETELSIFNSPHMLWHKLEINIFIFLEDWAKREAKEWTVFSSFYPDPPLSLKNTNLLTSLESLYGPLNWPQCLCWPCGQNRVLLFQKHAGGPWEGHMLINLPPVYRCVHILTNTHLFGSPSFSKKTKTLFLFSALAATVVDSCEVGSAPEEGRALVFWAPHSLPFSLLGCILQTLSSLQPIRYGSHALFID